MPRSIYVLAFCCFAVSTQAYFINGLVFTLSDHLGIGVAVAAQLGSAFALAYALTAPFIAAIAQRFFPKHVIIAGLAATTALNAISMIADTYTELFALRLLSGVVATLIIPISAICATYLVAPAQMGRALALIMGGVAGAFLFGLPVTSLAVAHGGWRAAFLAVAALGLLALIGAIFTLPSTLRFQQRRTVGVEMPADNQIASLLTLNFLIYAAPFATFAFLEVLVSSFAANSGVHLAVYQGIIGAGCCLGLILGARAADASAGWPFLKWACLAAAASQALIRNAAFAGDLGPAVLGVGFIVAATALFALLPVIQRMLAAAAGSHAPIIFALNGSLTFLGQATGTAFAGVFVSQFGLGASALTGFGLAVAVLLIAVTVGVRVAHPTVPSTAE